eukprot:m.302289 g.302289  ORF g.302289 m.302289 type:complete len:330 (+) comp15103_c0_seq1:56-1045(+)
MARRDPPFELAAPSRFDLSTYMGRVRHFQELTDVRGLFYTAEQYESARKLLDDFKNGTISSSVTNTQLWDARKICNAYAHPQTGERMFPLFRMAAFAPVNVPIVSLMLMPISSPWFVGGMQVVNQSYNVAVNYANRNVSGNLSTTQFAGAFAGAVVTSCALALGLNRATRGIQQRGGTIGTICRFVIPFTAVVSAGIVNLVTIRQKELQDGISVFDHEGNDRGRSHTAGKVALAKCSLARVLWSIPPMLLPAVFLAPLSRLQKLKSRPRLMRVIEIGVISSLIFVSIPPALAFFPQIDSIAAEKLEPEFQNMTDSQGRKIDKFVFNKGL